MITFVLTGPVSPAGSMSLCGEIDLVQGADYFAADGQGLQWTFPASPAAGYVPDLTGATVTWDFFPAASNTVAASFACEVLSGTAVQLELSAAQTVTIPYSQSEIRDRYELWATLASGHKIRIAQGLVYVEA